MITYRVTIYLMHLSITHSVFTKSALREKREKYTQLSFSIFIHQWMISKDGLGYMRLTGE